MFKTPPKNTKATQLALVNSFVATHDLACICQKPAIHCLHILLKQLQPELTEEDKNQIKQCLGTETTGQEEDVGFDLEGLDTLFAEDDIEKEDITG